MNSEVSAMAWHMLACVNNTTSCIVNSGGTGMTGQMLAFYLALVMVAIGIVCCVYSVWERTSDKTQQSVKAVTQTVTAGKTTLNKAYINDMKEAFGEEKALQVLTVGPNAAANVQQPFTLTEVNALLGTIVGIKDPAFQVGVFLVVFGLIIMMLVNFMSLSF